MIEKRPLVFPVWAEAAFVVVLLIMSVVEYRHEQWVWAGIFGFAGLFFGIGVILRIHSGDKNGQA